MICTTKRISCTKYYVEHIRCTAILKTGIIQHMLLVKSPTAAFCLQRLMRSQVCGPDGKSHPPEGLEPHSNPRVVATGMNRPPCFSEGNRKNACRVFIRWTVSVSETPSIASESVSCKQQSPNLLAYTCGQATEKRPCNEILLTKTFKLNPTQICPSACVLGTHTCHCKPRNTAHVRICILADHDTYCKDHMTQCQM